MLNSEKVTTTSISKENVINCFNKWVSITPGNYESLKDIEIAIRNFNKSLQYNKDDDLKQKSQTYRSLAYAYILLHDLEKSKEFIEKALDTCEKLNDKKGIIECYNLFLLRKGLKQIYLTQLYKSEI